MTARKIATWAAILLGPFLAVYLAIGFVILEFNVFAWSAAGRFALIWAGLMGLLLALRFKVDNL